MSPRVLVIDDESDIREITEMTLARIGGWDVIGADNGRTGAELAASEAPDAVLLDVMMPGLDGEATARLIRSGEAGATLPIVLLSAATSLPGWAADVHVLGLIGKPFDPLELPDRMRELLGW